MGSYYRCHYWSCASYPIEGDKLAFCLTNDCHIVPFVTYFHRLAYLPTPTVFMLNVPNGQEIGIFIDGSLEHFWRDFFILVRKSSFDHAQCSLDHCKICLNTAILIHDAHNPEMSTISKICFRPTEEPECIFMSAQMFLYHQRNIFIMCLLYCFCKVFWCKHCCHALLLLECIYRTGHFFNHAFRLMRRG